MKTTINIPDVVMEDAMRYTGASTRKEAVVTALIEFNRRKRMAALVRHSGSCDGMLSNDEIEALDDGEESGNPSA